jgi:hypothetical protein
MRAIPLIVHRVAIEVLGRLWGARGRHGLEYRLWLRRRVEARSEGVVGGCELSRHQCGFAWMDSDCTRLAGEGEAVVGWRVVVWCVVAAAAAMVSARGEGSSRSVGWLALARSLALGETGRDSLELRGRQPAGNTRGTDDIDTGMGSQSRTLESNQTKQPATTTHINTARRRRDPDLEALRHELM